MASNPKVVSSRVDLCPPIPRLWQLALQPGCWPVDLSEHLLSCARCRGYLRRAIHAVHQREAAEQKLAAALLLLAVGVRGRAHQPFALPRPADQFDTGPDRDDSVATFDFEDPNLRAIVSRLDEGGFLLRIESRKLKPGEPVLVMIKGQSGMIRWARYVMLRRGYRKSVGHARLEVNGLEEPLDQLFLDPVNELPAEAADLLRESYFQACLDAPESLKTWQTWAHRALEHASREENVRRVLVEILRQEEG